MNVGFVDNHENQQEYIVLCISLFLGFFHLGETSTTVVANVVAFTLSKHRRGDTRVKRTSSFLTNQTLFDLSD